MAKDEVKYSAVVIGGSAGSLDVLISIVEALPEKAGLSYVVIVHRKNDSGSILSELLSTKTKLKVKEVEDKESILPDYIYVAPSDYHLLFEDKHSFSLDSSERVHYSRPSIDVSFESVAEVFGEKAIGILLSGANADGAMGMLAIRAKGGYTIAQDPLTAEVGFMPQQAILLGGAESVLGGMEIGKYLQEIISR